MPLTGDPSKDIDEATQGLLGYCAEHDIYTSPKIIPRRIPGRGLGIYTTARISKGEKLMQVPTSALLTAKSIPNSFIDQTARKSIPVHAQLAAYLTFGLEEHSNPYEKWIATWPSLAEFTSSMPMFWPEPIVKPPLPKPESKPVRGQSSPYPRPPLPLSILPPPTTGAWNLSSTTTEPSGSTSVAATQLLKLQNHLEQIAILLPQHAEGLLSPTSAIHWRFIHMWCCVNTRCFYYLHPHQSDPLDPNEAMAMCPGMDLFNHTDKPGCFTKYDKSGYMLTADRTHEIGEEVLLSYGSHTNDVLWAEYGFMMDENNDDSVRIDEIVLRGVKEKHKRILEEHDYLGEYWLKQDGPCWRTEVVAWAEVLIDRELKKVLKGTWMPSIVDKSSRMHRLEIEAWLTVIAGECERNIEGLTTMSTEQIVELAGVADDVLVAQDHQQDEVSKIKKEMALTRHGMCIKRWQQIRQMSIKGEETWLSAW